MHFDRNHQTLYVFDEINIKKKTNQELAELVKRKGVKPNELIIADSAEPKSIREMLGCDLMIRGAEKGKGQRSSWIQILARLESNRS